MSELFESIQKSDRPYVIAEIGVNYYDVAAKEGISALDAAKLMIESAAAAGADATKFQSYKADTLAAKDSPAYWDQSEEPSRSQHELFSRYDSFGSEEYRILASHCDDHGVAFLSTPFDFDAVDYLDELCPAFKVSSSDITNWPFLKRIAQKSKPVFLSTGASNRDEIKDAVSILEKHGNGEICVLHCILSYPTRYEDANLRMIEHLASLFPRHLIGYSDHTRPDPQMTCLSVAYQIGARMIEKHFTLDKSLPGNDHYHAMDPDDLKVFIENVGRENPAIDPTIAAQIGGEHEKRCIEAEKSARLNARRSVVAVRDIKSGEAIRLDMVTFKRPGTGLSPRDLDVIVGAKAKTDIAADTVLTLEMFEQ
jgi:N-acetylneuraminate synthase